MEINKDIMIKANFMFKGHQKFLASVLNEQVKWHFDDPIFQQLSAYWGHDVSRPLNLVRTFIRGEIVQTCKSDDTKEREKEWIRGILNITTE